MSSCGLRTEPTARRLSAAPQCRPQLDELDHNCAMAAGGGGLETARRAGEGGRARGVMWAGKGLVGARPGSPRRLKSNVPGEPGSLDAPVAQDVHRRAVHSLCLP